MVRLKVTLQTGTGKVFQEFQFLDGAIKRRFQFSQLSRAGSFNSLMVRLKGKAGHAKTEARHAFQFLDGAIKSPEWQPGRGCDKFVSIP